MAETKIEWADYTFNHVRGCTKVSPGCTNCYADAMSGRNPKTLGVWGPNGTRVVAAESYWWQPLKWDWDAAKAGERRRVFCASLADVFEGPETMPADSVSVVDQARLRLFNLIRQTPNLDWLLLTKRPENVMACLNEAKSPRPAPADGPDDLYDWLCDWTSNRPPRNVWLGASVEDQQRADDRIPHLLRTPAAVRFLSCEPLLGPVDLEWWLGSLCPDCRGRADDGECRKCAGLGRIALPEGGCVDVPNIHWVICGGESGPGARPMNLDWARSLVSQCKAAGVACFVKQLGSRPVEAKRRCEDCGGDGDEKIPCGPDDETCEFCGGTGYHGGPLTLTDRKGGDISEFPAALRVRQLPSPPEAAP